MVSALEWNVKVDLIRKTARLLEDRAMELRYEELITNPSQSLHEVSTFLGVSFEPEMLDFWQQSKKFIDPKHSDLIFQPIIASNLQKWRNQLSPLETKKFEFFSKQRLLDYGYEVSQDPVTLIESLAFIIEIGINLPIRLLQIIRTSFVMKIASKFGRAYHLD